MISTAKNKSRFLAYFYTLFVFVGTFSLIHGWYPQLYRHVYLCFGMVMLTAFMAPAFFKSRSFVLILLYSAIVYLNHLWGDPYTDGKELLDGLTLASCAGMSYYILTTDDQKNKRLIIFASFLVILVDTIGTLVMYIVNSDIVRFVQGFANDGDNESTLAFYRYGLVEYDVLHGLPVLVPPLVMWLKQNSTSFAWKLFAWGGLFLIILILYIGDATTPFLLALFALVLSILIVLNNHKRSVRRLATITIISLPFLLFGDSLKMGMLNTAYNVTDGELREKIDDMRDMQKSGEMEGDVDVRYGLYQESFDLFLSNPLIGSDDQDELGGHSAFLDRLAAFGLLGVIPWLMAFFSIVKFNYKYLPPRARDFFIVGVICFAVLLLLKNMSTFYTWFSFTVLMTCMLTLDVERNHSR